MRIIINIILYYCSFSLFIRNNAQSYIIRSLRRPRRESNTIFLTNHGSDLTNINIYDIII